MSFEAPVRGSGTVKQETMGFSVTASLLLHFLLLSIHFCSLLNCKLLTVFWSSLITSNMQLFFCSKTLAFWAPHSHFLSAVCSPVVMATATNVLSAALPSSIYGCSPASRVSLLASFLSGSLTVSLDLGSVYFFLSLHFSSPFKCCKAQELMQAAHSQILALWD